MYTEELSSTVQADQRILLDCTLAEESLNYQKPMFCHLSPGIAIVLGAGTLQRDGLRTS